MVEEWLSRLRAQSAREVYGAIIRDFVKAILGNEGKEFTPAIEHTSLTLKMVETL